MDSFKEYEKQLQQKYLVQNIRRGTIFLGLLFLLAAFCFLFLPSCGVPFTRMNTGRVALRCSLPTVVMVQSGLLEEQTDAILAGVNYWNSELDGAFQIMEVDGEELVNNASLYSEMSIVIVLGEDEVFHSPNLLAIHRPRYKYDGNKQVCLEGSLIVLRKTFVESNSSVRIQSVVSHELGHALGLGHLNNRNELMYKFIRKNLISPRRAGKRTINKLKDYYGTLPYPPQEE